MTRVFLSFLTGVIWISSVSTLVVISFDRLFAVFCPIRESVTSRRPFVFITAVWLFSCMTSLPHLIFYELLSFHLDDGNVVNMCIWPPNINYDPPGSCITNYQRPPILDSEIYQAFLTIPIFFIPVTSMVLVYALIVWKLWTTSAPGEHHKNLVDMQRNARRRVKNKIYSKIYIYLFKIQSFYCLLNCCYLLSRATVSIGRTIQSVQVLLRLVGGV